MKRLLALILALTLSLPLIACSSKLAVEEPDETEKNETKETAEQNKTVEEQETEEPMITEEPYVQPTDSESVQHSLDGKKFIFIGNSYTYYGKCVLEKSNSNRSLSDRSHDKGYFYQIAK